MKGRRSQFPNLVGPIDNIEKLLHHQAQYKTQNPAQEPIQPMAGQGELPKQMKEYFIPSYYKPSTCIHVPEVPAAQYEIKSSTIQMLPSFYGLTNEDPYKHLDEFLEICSTVKIQNFTDDALKLTLFPFSLKDKAKYWLGTIGRPIKACDEMQKEFLKKFYPIGRTNTMRRAITSFTQTPGEMIHESWERLKELLRKCPHHGLSKWQIVQAFYEGLTEQYRQMVDASCGGAFMSKSEDEAYDLFEMLSENSINHASLSSYERAVGPSKWAGLYEIKNRGEIESKLDLNAITQRLDRMDLMDQKVDQILAFKKQASIDQPTLGLYPSPNQATHEACSLCTSSAHHVSECPIGVQLPPVIQEQVQAAQGFNKPNNDPFSNTYNPGWKNHPNFSWKSQQPQPKAQPQAQYQNQTFYKGPMAHSTPHQFQHNFSQPSYGQPSYGQSAYGQPPYPPMYQQPSPPQPMAQNDDNINQLHQLILAQN